MTDNKEVLQSVKEWMVTIFIVLFLVVGFALSVFTKEYKATRKTNKLEVGDRFKVEFVSDNPYEDHIIFGGTITAKHGNYIQYVNEKGDTVSTNIRDAYRFPKMFTVTVYKNKEK